MCRGSGGGDDRLDEPAAPGQEEPGREQQGVLVQGEEQAVPHACPAGARCGRAAAGTPATVGGEFTWITRSRSPTSMPSSSADVDTITQSRPSANACSARRRSSSDSDAWTRCVVTPRARSSRAEHLDEPLGVAEHQPLLAPVQRAR